MKLKEIHNDIERYLKNDCYCQYEIYDTSGFFYQLFKENEDCEKLIETDDFISALCKDQILIFWKEESRISVAVRYDATENNVLGIKEYADAGKQFTEDKFNKDGYKKTMSELLSLVDLVMVGR